MRAIITAAALATLTAAAAADPGLPPPAEGRWKVMSRKALNSNSAPSCGRAARTRLTKAASGPLTIDGYALTWAGVKVEMSLSVDEEDDTAMWGGARRRFLRWVVKPRFVADDNQVARVEVTDIWIYRLAYDSGASVVSVIVLRSEGDFGLDATGRPDLLRTVCQDSIGGFLPEAVLP